MKRRKILLFSAAAFLLSGLLTGCGQTKDDNKLRIIVKSAGFGEQWIRDLETKFEADHPDIDVDITAQYDVSQLISSHLESRNNKDDLYINIGTDWKSYAAQGYFADLTSFLYDTVDGVKVKEKVADEYEGSLYFTKSNGDQVCYRLPWTSGIGGIYYNKKMFTKHGWDTWLKTTYEGNTTGVPETFEQLEALCKKIVNDKIPVSETDRRTAVKPFAYTGANTDYFDYTVFDWWGQIAGVDAIKDFLKYESYDNFDVTKNATYAALKTATNYWTKLFVEYGEDGLYKGESSYVIEDSKSKAAAAAQKEFANGYAAMMFNGDWLYNEILDYNLTGDNFALGLMKTPKIAEANDNYVNTSYVIGEDQFIVIPKSSKKKDMAKEFIKLIISNEGCTTFTKKANGFLAYDTDFTNADITDEFILETINLRNSYVNKFTNYSSNRKYLCNFLDVWCTGAQRPFLSLLNGSVTLDKAFTSIHTTAKANWADWTARSK